MTFPLSVPFMEELHLQDEEIVHLARVALTGRRDEVETHLRRVARRYRAESPGLAAALGRMLSASPSSAPASAAAVRRVASEAMAAVPVDGDSRLDLLRIEAVPALPVEPIWIPAVGTALESLVRERRAAGRLAAQGLTPTRTVVFTGPPGVGKTLAARWLAYELGRPLLVLDLSTVMSSFLGRTGTNLRHVMDFARGLDCVLLLDEFDALAKRRDDVHEVGELKRLVTSLLQEIDAWPARGILVAATNHPDLLDPAVWRRFERMVAFPMPADEHLRRAIDAFAAGAFSAEGDAAPRPLLEALTVAFRGASFSDVEREIVGARRSAIIDERPLVDALAQVVLTRTGRLPRAARRDVAAALRAAGLSQRQVHALTGVSRDTLRKDALASGSAPSASRAHAEPQHRSGERTSSRRSRSPRG